MGVVLLMKHDRERPQEEHKLGVRRLIYPAIAVTPAAAPCTRYSGYICHGSRTCLGALHLP
jgi:hypothetical protein